MNITPLHILIIGIVVYVAYRIFFAKKNTGKNNRPQPMTPPTLPPHGEEKKKQALDAYKIAENTWDRLRSKPPEAKTPEQGVPPDTTAKPAPAVPLNATPKDTPGPKAADITLPKDFDFKDFLSGATAMYARIRESWLSRDMEDLRQFTTLEFFEDLKRRAEKETRPANPEIPQVSANLIELTTQGDKTLASVFYEAAPARDAFGQQSRLREVWRFVQDNSIPGSSWLLENIQQVQ